MLADRGKGPIVVFESGLGGAHTAWARVQPEIRQSSVVYCRAGQGDSDPAPDPRTVDGIADDLVDLLDAIAERLPDNSGFILVGHSFGGLIVPRAAERAGQPIAGLVLVDPTPLGLWKQEKVQRMARRSRTVVAAVFAFGPTRAFLHRLLTRNMNAEIAAEANTFEFTKAGRQAWEQEESALIAATAGFDPETASVPEVPLIVLSAGKIPRTAAKAYDEVVADHERIATRASHGSRRVIPDVGHRIPLDAPDVIVDAINEIASPEI